MKNPFEYGGVVSGEAFRNRKQELADLLRAMQNAEKFFVFSIQRVPPFQAGESRKPAIER